MTGTGWLRRGAIYQVYPRSFQDADGDGVGDLEGVRRRLRYLRVARRRRRSGSRRSTARRWRTSATTSPTTATSTRRSARSRTSTRSPPRRTALGLQADPRLRPEPHVDRAPVVPRTPPSATGTSGATGDPDRPPTNWVSNFGGPAWTWHEGRGAWYYHAYLPRAARPGLAQPGRPRGDARRPALLGRPRRRRLPHRRTAPDDQGRPLARQPAQPGLARGRRPLRGADPRVHHRPRRGARARGAHPRRGRAGPRADRRAVPAARAAHALLRRRPRPAVELPPDLHAVGGGGARRPVEPFERVLPDGAWPNYVLGNHDRPRIATPGPRSRRAWRPRCC